MVYLPSIARSPPPPETVKASVTLETMKYQLVLQWPASSIQDFDAMIAIENKLIENLSEGSEVDGHDFGSGEGNIFILTDDPERAFSEIEASLNNDDSWLNARVAYREITKDHYTILYPEDLKVFRIV